MDMPDFPMGMIEDSSDSLMMQKAAGESISKHAVISQVLGFSVYLDACYKLEKKKQQLQNILQ